MVMVNDNIRTALAATRAGQASPSSTTRRRRHRPTPARPAVLVIAGLLTGIAIVGLASVTLLMPGPAPEAAAGTTTTTLLPPQTGAFALASDPTNGPLIAVLPSNGAALVKEGSLSAGWDTEHTNVYQLAVASDPTNGSLIAVNTDSSALIKEGSLTAGWDTEYSRTLVQQVTLASDATNGPLIGVLTGTGTALVKEGSLSAAWGTERTGV